MRIILGITGSIAADKAPLVARELMRSGAEVTPVLTEGALQFTTATALSALTKQTAITSIFPADKKSSSDSGTWHIHLARSATAMLIAPCSATTIGKLAGGIYDNAVTLLASSLPQTTPLIIAPAMDEEMWLQPAVQENIRVLRSRGVLVIEPTIGALASGLTGKGRMLEPAELVMEVRRMLDVAKPLEGKRVLITGGPTYEPIDPVRFIGNRSTGKMAAALARAAERMGAEVTLIMGPSAIATNGTIERINVETSDEMAMVVLSRFVLADILIMSAAVADFRPESVSQTKLKKRATESENTTLELVRTQDILNSIKEFRRPDQTVVGFALEKGAGSVDYALGKLREKELDYIVLNDISEFGSGFAHDTNKVTIFSKAGKKIELPLLTKDECAVRILETIS